MVAYDRAGRLVTALASAALLAACASGVATSPPATTAPATDSPAPSVPSTPPPEASPSPSLAPVAYGSATLVHGTESCSPDFAVPTPDPSGVTHLRDAELTCTVRFDDPRVSGTKTGPINVDLWGDLEDGAWVQWGAPRRIENDGGAWVGSFAGTYTSETGDMIYAWFEGTGGYAGLSFMEWIAIPPGAVTTGYPVVGLIFPGSPPAPYGTR